MSVLKQQSSTLTHVSFQGGVKRFPVELRKWYAGHRHWPEATFSAPTSKNVVTVEIFASHIVALRDALDREDQPEGLLEAVMLIPDGDDFEQVNIVGLRRAQLIAEINKMVEESRPLGVSPKDMAESGGW